MTPFSPSNWPPLRQDFFRGSSLHRPVFQGDIFENVPYVKGQAGDFPGADPKLKVERRKVAALCYPCEMYSNGILARVQTIAVLREAAKLGIPDNWQGAFFSCPLPDLTSDGRTWIIDLRTMGNIDRSFLTPRNRLETLTEFGWAYLRQRLGIYFTRVSYHLGDLQQAGSVTWQETELWEQWCAMGRATEEFQQWLDTTDINIGFTRRKALERGMYRLVASAMR
ncbi:MAG: hypothetical protein Q8O86_02810 [Dehalococcoidia bacterium]|nr:hypothetical protein [Dehalococcoidia bacterium]